MQFHVLVETRPRKGVADPEGATIERSLPALGFGGVSGVRVGKAFRFTIEADGLDEAWAEVDEMCARFLTNPVIEDAEVSIGTDPAEVAVRPVSRQDPHRAHAPERAR